MENNWQDKLRESLENYEKTTPEGLWEEVSLSVENKWKSHSRRNIIWLLSSVSAAACVLFAIIVSREHVPAVAIEDLHALVEVSSIADELVSNDILEKTEQAHNIAIKRNVVFENPVDDIKEADSYLTNTLENYLISIDSETVSDDKGVLESADEKVNDVEIWPYETEKPIRLAGRLSVGLFSSNSVGSGRLHEGYDGLYGSDAAMMARSAASGLCSHKFSDVLINSNGGEIKTNIRHRQPIRIGLSIDYGLSEAIGIETGLNYTLLVSNLTSGSSGSHYETKQTLHYVGIPINMKLRLFDFAKGKGKVYFSSGAMVEKCVYGQTRTDYYTSDNPVQSGMERLTVKPLQWSVNTTIGCGYALGGVVSIYVEPGFSYHFDNNSPVETVYKDRSFNFSLRTGLRFSIGK